MEKTIRGGLYRVGDRFVDATGKDVPAEQIPPELRKAAQASTPEGSTTGDLGADFPGDDVLIAAGLTTRAAVAAKTNEELLALNGIGPKTLEEIREALK